MAFELGEGYIDLTIRRSSFMSSMSSALGALKVGFTPLAAVAGGITRLVTGTITTVLQTVQRVAESMFRILKRLSVVIIAYATLSLRAFGNFERSMRRATAVSEVTSTQFELMTRMAETQSIRLNMAASKTANAFYFLGSAGLSATQQIQAFVPVATLAKAATMEMGETAEMVVDTMKGFHLGFERTTHVTDVLAKAVTSSNMTFAQLGESLSLVSGVARTANNTLEETTALIAAMADVGIKGSRAGVYLRRGLINLMAPMSALRDLLAQYNIQIYDSSGRMKSFLTIINEVSAVLRNASEQQRNLMFKTMFGARAITGQIAIFDRGYTALRDFTEMLEKSGGTAEKIAQKQMLSFWERLGQVWQRITRMSRTIGQLLSPAILRLATSIGTMADKITVFLRKHGTAVQMWGERIAARIQVLAGAFWNLAKYIYSDWRTAIGYGLNSVLTMFVAFGRSLKHIWEKISAELVAAWQNAMRNVAIRFLEIRAKIQRWRGIEVPPGWVVHGGAGRSIESLVGPRATAGIMWADVLRKTTAEFSNAARLIALNVPSEIRDIFGDMADRIVALDAQIAKKYAQQLNREIIRTGGRGRGGLAGAGIPAAAGAVGAVGFVGLAEAWKTMARALTEPQRDIATEITQKQILDVGKKSLTQLKTETRLAQTQHSELIDALDGIGTVAP